MNPTLHYLFGKLTATVAALAIESEHLIEEDEDAHKRLAKLINRLDEIVVEMGSADLIPGGGSNP